MKKVICTKCGTLHVLKGKQYLCKDCKREHQRMTNRRNRARWYEIIGSACITCGYSKSTAALDFHHRDPSEKLFAIAPKLNAINPDSCKSGVRDQILAEVAKCDLICANCHRERHELENE